MPHKTKEAKKAYNRAYYESKRIELQKSAREYYKVNRDRVNERACEWTRKNRPAGSARMSWSAMRKRCLDPSHDNYAHYGGVGVTVCERWSSFANFLVDMGERPEGMTLDRIDVDGNYNKENCRWATAKEQANNKRNNRVVTSVS